MALTKCWCCNAEIDDTLKDCPHCKMPVITFPNMEYEPKETPHEPAGCRQCGRPLPANAAFCPQCAFPTGKADNVEKRNKEEDIQKVQVTSVAISPSSKRKWKRSLFIAALILVASVSVAFLFTSAKNHALERQKQEAEEEYQGYIDYIYICVAKSAFECDECGRLIHAVWSNTIFHTDDAETDPFTKEDGGFRDDFNDSIDALFNDSEFKEKTARITEARFEAEEYIKKMMSPPEKYREAYAAAKEMYDSFMQFSTLVLSPSGNLKSYTESFGILEQDITNKIKNANLHTSDMTALHQSLLEG